MDHLTISRKLRSNKAAAEGYVHYDSTYVKVTNTTYVHIYKYIYIAYAIYITEVITSGQEGKKEAGKGQGEKRGKERKICKE